jgi:hypothetical protein
MTTRIKNLKLLAGTSSIALGMLALASSPALAFEEVNWVWNATVDETVTKTVTIDIDIDPTGMVMLEDLQVQIGDVTATSVVTGIYNNQPGGGTAGGTQEVDLGSLQLDANYVLGGAFDTEPPNEATATGDVVTGATVESGFVDETDIPAEGANGTVTATIDLGTIMVEVEQMEADPLDAMTELPEIISAATAVGNNVSIDADTAVQLHEAQWTVGDVSIPPGEDGDANFTWEGVVGVEAANITATSLVYDILNASVDSSATAVSNNLTVNVEAEGSDRLVIADVLQVSVADVSASSTVYDVTVDNYLNLGAMDRPLVNSVATAVGNNKSISVNAPSVDVGNGGDNGTAP